MELNNIPKQGRFGTIADKLNNNFDIIRVKIGEVEYYTRKNKGLFADATALNAAIPTPAVGDWALVGDSFPAEIYVCTTAGTWTDSEETYDGDNVDLNDYLSLADFADYQEEIEGKVDESMRISNGGSSFYTVAGFIRDNGLINPSEEYHATDFIPIYEWSDIVIKNGEATGSTYLLAFYNEDKAFIAESAQHGTSISIPHVSIPAGAKYMRSSTKNTTLDDVVLSVISTTGIALYMHSNMSGGNSISGIFSLHGYLGTDGVYHANEDYRATDFILIDNKSDIVVKDGYSGLSSSLICFYDKDKTFINGSSSVRHITVTAANIPSNAVYVRFGTSTETVNSISVVNASTLGNTLLITKTNDLIGGVKEDVDELKTQTAGLVDKNLVLNAYGYYKTNGTLQPTENAMNTGKVAIDGRERLFYRVNISNEGLAVAFFDANEDFLSNISVPGGFGLTTGTIDLTDEDYEDAKYVCISYYDGQHEYAYFGGRIYNPDSLDTRISSLESVKNISLSGDTPLKILIFGDSITDCATISITNNATTYYQLNELSNSYVKNGETIRFSMWPYLLTKYFKNCEVRNYAKSGASYKDATRTSGNERQNLSYQMQVASNDLANPNGAFPTAGNFVPDIVIFALGTNDDTPNDTYESAMAKSYAELDRSNFCDSARLAFITSRREFPSALHICILPIQRASREQAAVGVNTELAKMAKRYSMQVIDGASEIGIVRDFEINGAVGVMLKDGLHPNDKGQNEIAKVILSSIRNFWFDDTKLNA